jgi:hypothetical protein
MALRSVLGPLVGFLAVVFVLTGCGTNAARPVVAPRPSKPLWCPAKPDPSNPVAIRALGLRQGTLDVRYLLGIQEQDARMIVAAAGCIVRVIKKDGKEVGPILMNWVSIRVDLWITRGIVGNVGVG